MQEFIGDGPFQYMCYLSIWIHRICGESADSVSKSMSNYQGERKGETQMNTHLVQNQDVKNKINQGTKKFEWK